MRNCFLIVLAALLLSCGAGPNAFKSDFPEDVTRYWLGPDYWTNMLQDWQLNMGRIECIDGSRPLRTVQLLTRYLSNEPGAVQMAVQMGRMSNDPADSNTFAGFLIGAGNLDLDYRARAIIHHASGVEGGLVVGLNGSGNIVFLNNEDSLKELKPSKREGAPVSLSEHLVIKLTVSISVSPDSYTLSAGITDLENHVLQSAVLTNTNMSHMDGNVALVAHSGAGADGRSYWFRDWSVAGSKIVQAEDQAYGPILNAMYTMSENIVKMTVQLPPIAPTDPQFVGLDLKQNGSWKRVTDSKIMTPGWYAGFLLNSWSGEEDVPYRVVYELPMSDGSLEPFYYHGTIRKNPVDKNEVVVAAFTGNSNTHGSFRDGYHFTKEMMWFPHNDIVESVRRVNPDVLFYSGDQVYESRPVPPDYSGDIKSMLDYLYKWYDWCWAHGELARERPCIAIPDDHDVFHGNIWGAGGARAPKAPPNGNYPPHYNGFKGHWQQDQGGYKMPPEFVNMVEGTQTSNLPNPYNSTPVKQGIGVYYTDMIYGGISFAILEDRKFKSAPSVIIPEGNVVNGFFQNKNFDVKLADKPNARLLGERQLDFLQDWVTDWKDAYMKVVLSQTIFANVSTYPEEFKTDAGTPSLSAPEPGVIPDGYKMAIDMDSNGWPQTGRNKALRVMRKGFAFHIAGDQHLGSVVRHGVNAWNDAGWSFCVPSIANLWPRRWFPPAPGKNHQVGMPDYTGQYRDGFGNLITVHAVSNPVQTGHEPERLHDRAPGFGVVRLNKAQQTITMECWPRYADLTDPSAKQYPGWPITISMFDNYGRDAAAFLPSFEWEEGVHPVMQVIEEETGDVLYTVRIRGKSYRPKVFNRGQYTIHLQIPEDDLTKTFTGISAMSADENKNISVTF